MVSPPSEPTAGPALSRGPPDPARAEAELVRRAAAGDRAAFATIVQTHQDRIARLAVRLLGSTGKVEDVVQDVFVAALRKLGSFRGDASFATWLTAIALNQCRSYQRSRRLWKGLPARLRKPAPDPEPSADHGAMRRQAIERVQATVRNLSAGDREVIVLRYLEELPVSEIAALLGVAKNTVEVRLTRARSRLRERLADLTDQV